MVCDGGRTAKSFEKFKVNLNDYPHRVLPLQNVDANATLVEYPDMVRLPYLHEVRKEEQRGSRKMIAKARGLSWIGNRLRVATGYAPAVSSLLPILARRLSNHYPPRRSLLNSET
jgi:hypothetical protein